MQTFCDYLNNLKIEKELFTVLCAIKDAVKLISSVVRTGFSGKAGTKNIFGEEQLELDVLADNYLQQEFKKNPLIGLLASEEMPDQLKTGDGDFAIAYDPLDGSSLVDVNLAVGSIFGIYKLNGKKTFVGLKGDNQVASLIAVYGPKTTIILAIKGVKVAEFVLNEDLKFYLNKNDLKIGPGKMFAPGNLRACKDNKKYLKLLNFWCNEEYTLRYSGGMVPDINQILIKGKGIFAYPSHKDAPQGKLRLLYECAPMALIMETADGAASDGHKRILDQEVKRLDQRTPIFIGSKEEVKRCEDFLS